MLAQTINYGPAGTIAHSPAARGGSGERFWGSDGFSFGDLLDIVNPFQHLPLVSDLYRTVTGDETSPGSRVLGGALFGGVGGLLAGFFSAAVEQVTGSSPAEKALTFLDSPAANSNVPASNGYMQLAQLEAPRKSYDTASYIKRYAVAQQLYSPAQSASRIDLAA